MERRNNVLECIFINKGNAAPGNRFSACVHSSVIINDITRLPGKLNQPRSPKIACERYTLQYSTRAELITVSFLLDRILIYATERCTAER